MPDIVDFANDLVEVNDVLAVMQVRSRANRLEAEPTGECLLCEEPVDYPKRWCDAEHRDRWEKEQRVRKEMSSVPE